MMRINCAKCGKFIWITGFYKSHDNKRTLKVRKNTKEHLCSALCAIK